MEFCPSWLLSLREYDYADISNRQYAPEGSFESKLAGIVEAIE